MSAQTSTVVGRLRRAAGCSRGSRRTSPGAPRPARCTRRLPPTPRSRTPGAAPPRRPPGRPCRYSRRADRSLASASSGRAPIAASSSAASAYRPSAISLAAASQRHGPSVDTRREPVRLVGQGEGQGELDQPVRAADVDRRPHRRPRRTAPRRAALRRGRRSWPRSARRRRASGAAPAARASGGRSRARPRCPAPRPPESPRAARSFARAAVSGGLHVVRPDRGDPRIEARRTPRRRRPSRPPSTRGCRARSRTTSAGTRAPNRRATSTPRCSSSVARGRSPKLHQRAAEVLVAADHRLGRVQALGDRDALLLVGDPAEVAVVHPGHAPRVQHVRRGSPRGRTARRRRLARSHRSSVSSYSPSQHRVDREPAHHVRDRR